MAEQAEAAGIPPLWELPADVARQNAELSFQAFNQPMPESVRVEDRQIPGPAGNIPIKVFTPQGENQMFPLLIYFHGGGWVIGSPETHAKLCAELAEGAQVVVVSVGYRLAPEHPAPAALDDCIAAVRWCLEHATDLNATTDHFAVGGDSAGANLAAAACLRLRDDGGPLPSFQLLFYGAYHYDLDTESAHEHGEGKILDRRAMQWFWEHYLSGGANPKDPYIAPLHGNLKGLPPARLIVGTIDPLLDDSRLFTEKLEAADVPVVLSEYPDQPHLFLQCSAILDAGRRGVIEACMALREALRA